MNILLLEPDYKGKYPPIGLMKLAYFHKECRGDFVFFAKGEPPEHLSEKIKAQLYSSKYYSERFEIESYVSRADDIIKNKAWDRIYVTTLFTFEWEKTVAAIEFAKTLAGDPNKVFVGGVLATLMPKELEQATGIKPMTGLLTDSSALGFDDGTNIDTLTPDYSILDLTEYHYPMTENYIVRSTRGCGMKCSFCAVQTLEPDCVDYIPLKELINEIDEKYGPRKNLIMMDNNITKSKQFDRIIEDIIALGYGKGATKINPKTGKPNRVYVDFNQGLDMNFVTEEKMAQLGRLALKPLRIAFDHLTDSEKYIKALRMAEKNNFSDISNYMLYNAAAFKGKGKDKSADTPRELYERFRINVDLQTEFNERRRNEGILPVNIYSFPMKYIPLGNTDRSFIGENWTKKKIRSLQVLINPTCGVIYSEERTFYKNFGSTAAEFESLLQWPEQYLYTRRKKKSKVWDKLHREWHRLYFSLSEADRDEFENIISDNIFLPAKYLKIENSKMRKLYLHYLHKTNFIDFIKTTKNLSSKHYNELRNYLINEMPEILLANFELLSELKSKETYFAEILYLVSGETSLAVI